MLLHSIQVRQARATLNISRIELGFESKVSYKTLHRIEEDEEYLNKATMSTINKLRNYFKSRGIKFLQPEDEDEISGIGIRYYPKQDCKLNNKGK